MYYTLHHHELVVRLNISLHLETVTWSGNSNLVILTLRLLEV